MTVPRSGNVAHSFIDLSVHSLIRPSIHPLIYLLIDWLSLSFIPSIIHPSIHLFYHLFFHLFCLSFAHSFIYSFIHNPLTLFLQSVYPPLISMGLPKRHHIVVYLLAIVNEDCRTLQQRLKFHTDEVDAVTWLDEYTTTDVASSDDYGQSKKFPQRYFEALVEGSGGLQVAKLPLSILMAVLPSESGKDCERLSSGTKFALRQWLKTLYPPPPGGVERADSLETVFLLISKKGHQPVKSPFWSDQ